MRAKCRIPRHGARALLAPGNGECRSVTIAAVTGLLAIGNTGCRICKWLAFHVGRGDIRHTVPAPDANLHLLPTLCAHKVQVLESRGITTRQQLEDAVANGDLPLDFQASLSPYKWEARSTDLVDRMSQYVCHLPL